MSAIGRRIRARRDELGMTQAILAEKAGLGRSSIAQYERGRTRPRARELESLARAMNMTVDELLTGHKLGVSGGYNVGLAPVEPEQEILGAIVQHPLFNAKVRKNFHEFLMSLEKALFALPDAESSLSKVFLKEGGVAFNAETQLLERFDEELRTLGKFALSQPGVGGGPTALLTLKATPKGTPFKSGQTLLLEPHHQGQSQGGEDWFLVGLRGRVHFARPNPKEDVQGFLNPEGLVFSSKCEPLFKVIAAYASK